MNIIVTAVGSTGDIYPFLAVARLLRRRTAHRVVVIANERFRARAEVAGLEFRAHGSIEDYERSFTPPPGNPKNPIVLMRGASNLLDYNFFKPIPLTFDVIGEYDRSDTLLFAHGASFGARIARDVYRLPMLSGIMSPTAVPGSKDFGFGPLLQFFGNAVCTANINKFCAARGLAKIKSVDGWSLSPDGIAALFPDFLDAHASTWPAGVTAVGYQAFDADGHDDTAGDVTRFLNAKPTILFTSGTPIRTAHGLFREAVEVCRRLGRQGLLVTDFAGQVPADLPAFIRHVPYASFRRTFPLCEAVVHHGGIGTSLEGLLAGKPQFITPSIADQHYQAARLKELGVADTISMNKFTAERASPLFRSLLESDAVQDNCRALKLKMEQDDAEEKALRLFEAMIRRLGKG
jgi:rhamnosyltransferase subunit B